ncbi:reverse transcriptase domain-containing protein [Tanacetum coccineum]
MLTKSYEDVWPEMRQHKFFDNVTADHPEDIMASPPPQEKSSRPGFTGHISFAMHVSWSRIDFMGPFPSSSGNKYVLVAIDYVSKWVEAQAFPTNDARNVVNFLKRLFTRFGIPKALISDRGTHSCNHQMEKAMKRYGVVHRFSTVYHPQTNGQINELDEMRLDAYESSISYKERTKRLFPEKLKSRWYGPFSVSKDMKNGVIELYDEEGSEFIVNKQWVKPYQMNLLDTNRDDDVTLKDQGEVTVTKSHLLEEQSKSPSVALGMVFGGNTPDFGLHLEKYGTRLTTYTNSMKK